MLNFGAFLLALAAPILRRVLIALSLGVISYAGLAAVASQVVSAVSSNYGGMSGPVLQLLDLIGAGQGLGIVVSGIVARAAFGAVSRIGVMSA